MPIETLKTMKKLLIIISLFASHIGHAEAPKILSLKAQAAVIDRLLEEKVATVLPQLMRNNGIDMWIVMAREYNEDPVIRTLLPAIWHAARRRTVLVMFDQGIDDSGNDLGVEALAVARYDVGTVFKKSWDKEQQPDQWARLAEIIAAKNPAKIGNILPKLRA